MAWNDKTNEQRNSPHRPDGQPPDLDELLKSFSKKLNRLLGGSGDSGGSGGGFNGSNGPQGPAVPPLMGGGGLWTLVGVAVAAAALYGSVYIVDEQERGVVMRFGSHVATLQPGLSLRWPRPVERVYKVNVNRVRRFTHEASMLTQDENIIQVAVAIQYRIEDPEAYLFHVSDPEVTLRQVVESSVREVIGKSELDYVLTEGRREVAVVQRDLIQDILRDYRSGLLVVGVEMQQAKPPEQVKAAFDDAITAREDEKRLINEAEAYRNDVLPRARGSAARVVEEAEGYKQRVVASAKGDADRFRQVYESYRLAPEVTRRRLYLEALESVFSSSSKTLLADPDSAPLIYLPLDQMRRQPQAGRAAPRSEAGSPFPPPRRSEASTPVTARDRGRR